MKDRNVSGFSLVELLVAVALLVGVFAIIFPQYISLTRHSAVTRKMIKTQADAYNITSTRTYAAYRIAGRQGVHFQYFSSIVFV